MNKKKPKLTKKSQEMLQNNIGVIKYALKGKHLSEDTLQEIYLKLCQKMTKYDHNLSKITTFLHLHSNWSALDQFYRKKNKKEIPTCQLFATYDIASEKDDPLLLLEQKEEAEYIQSKIDLLPVVAKIIFGYYTFYEYNVQKVCRELKITRNIVHQQLDLAYQLLRESLQSYYDDLMR